MLIKNIIITLVLIIFSISCEIEMTPKQSKPAEKTYTDNLNINNAETIDHADEPVMLGGAYLTCTKIYQTSNNIGCGLIDKNSSQKIDLQNYEHKWRVVDTPTKKLVDIPIQTLQDNSFYHMELSYNDNSYKNHTVILEFFNKQQDITQSFNKNLSVLDKKIINLEFTIINTNNNNELMSIMSYIILSNKCPSEYKKSNLIFNPWQKNYCIKKYALKPMQVNVIDKVFRIITQNNNFITDQDNKQGNKDFATELIVCSTDPEKNYVFQHYSCEN